VEVEIKDFPREACAVGAAADLIGDRWSILVLRETFFGVRRFGEIQQNTGMAKNILTDRLNRLVDAGILYRKPYSERPPRDEYRLTEKGIDLWPLLIALAQWGAKWGDLELGPAIAFRHKGCGSVIEPRLVCPECGEPLDARAVEVLPGPAMLQLAARLDESA
jgi:DNA-binding HxlR family transcriptional regulator